jgi:hypothetical protein
MQINLRRHGLYEQRIFLYGDCRANNSISAIAVSRRQRNVDADVHIHVGASNAASGANGERDYHL